MLAYVIWDKTPSRSLPIDAGNLSKHNTPCVKKTPDHFHVRLRIITLAARSCESHVIYMRR